MAIFCIELRLGAGNFSNRRGGFRHTTETHDTNFSGHRSSWLREKSCSADLWFRIRAVWQHYGLWSRPARLRYHRVRCQAFKPAAIETNALGLGGTLTRAHITNRWTRAEPA